MPLKMMKYFLKKKWNASKVKCHLYVFYKTKTETTVVWYEFGFFLKGLQWAERS